MTASIQYIPPNPKAVIAELRDRDEWGAGYFGAPRGTRNHNGIDFLVEPLSMVCSTVTGTITKIGTCYRGAEYRYVQVDDEEGNHIRHFYVYPSLEVGSRVNKGTPIGKAQDLSIRYPKDDNHKEAMPNHVHLEIVREGTLYNTKEFINPDLYVFA